VQLLVGSPEWFEIDELLGMSSNAISFQLLLSSKNRVLCQNSSILILIFVKFYILQVAAA